MPFVDSRDDWARFSNSMVNTALCCPSRSTFLTGQTSDHTGIESNSETNQFKGRSTIANWLDDAGYQTGFVGKYLNKFPWGEDESYVPKGWDWWTGYTGKQTYLNFRLNENGTLIDYKGSSHNSTDVLSDRAVDFLEQVSKQEPFFAFVSYNGPHLPSIPPPRYADAEVEPIPEDEAFLEEDVSDKPRWIRQQNAPRPRDAARAADPASARAAGDRRRRQGHLPDAQRPRRARQHDRDVHDRPRDQPRRASLREEDLRLRGLLAGAAADPRPRACSPAASATWSATSTWRRRWPTTPGSRPAGGSTASASSRCSRATPRRSTSRCCCSGPRARATAASSGLRTKKWKYIHYTKTGERELYNLKKDRLELFNLLSTDRHKWEKKADELEQQTAEAAPGPVADPAPDGLSPDARRCGCGGRQRRSSIQDRRTSPILIRCGWSPTGTFAISLPFA